MAVDAARIGANFSDYEGSLNLGGGTFGVAQIDTRPLQQLAAYTFEYNRSKWAQEQKDLEKQAQEASDFASYDLTNAIPKYAKQLREGYDELYSWVQSNPDVMDYKKNPKGWLEYKKRKNELTDNIKYGVSQEIIYKAGQSKVESETRPEVKAFLQKQLDDQIAANDIRTPLKLQQYAAEPTVLPTVPTKKFDIIRKDSKGDMIIDREITVADQKFINSRASVMALGLQGEVLDVNSAEFKKLPPEAQKFRLEESRKAKATGRLATVDEAEIFTEALRHFKDPTTGKIDMEKVSASNDIIAGSVQAIDAYNQQMREEVAKIKAGYYSDNLGVLRFGVNGLDERDYKEIDYSDGEVTATDLYKVKLRAKAPITTYETTAKELDLKRENLAVEWYKAKTGRLNATDSGKPIPVLDKPADFIDQHVRNLKNLFRRTGGKNVTIEYGNVDAKTRLAIGLKAGETVTFWNDGDFIIHTPAGVTSDDGVTTDKQTRRKGTIENVVQGFIEAVKTTDLAGNDKDGTMAQGFQQNSEARIRQRWGSSAGKDIWNSPQWDNPDAAVTKETETKSKTYKIGNKTITESQIEKGAAKYKMSVEEYKRSIGL